MRKELEWKGKQYDIEAIRYGEMKEFLPLMERLATETPTDERFADVDRAYELLHCPQEVLDDLYAEEANQLIEALNEAQFGKVGADEGNGEGGAVVH